VGIVGHKLRHSLRVRHTMRLRLRQKLGLRLRWAERVHKNRTDEQRQAKMSNEQQERAIEAKGSQFISDFNRKRVLKRSAHTRFLT